MPHTESEALARYLGSIRPIYYQLFSMAYAITGNRDSAQYCLLSAMLEEWSSDEESGSRHGFREAMRRSVVRIARRCEAGETEWNGLSEALEEGGLRGLIAQESTELRRVLALRYGCGLSAGRIARICDTDASRVKAMLRRFEARLRRRLPAKERGRLDMRIARAVRSAMAEDSGAAPDMGGLFRSFQMEAASAQQPSRLPGRVLHGILAAVLAVICMAAFWFAAVVMQPPVLEEPAGIVEIAE